MIGAIIGDIAAWTYEHDREAFWNQLISYDDKVSLSEFGRRQVGICLLYQIVRLILLILQIILQPVYFL